MRGLAAARLRQRLKNGRNREDGGHHEGGASVRRADRHGFPFSKTARRIARDGPSASWQEPAGNRREPAVGDRRSQRAVSAAHGRCAIAGISSIGAWHHACSPEPVMNRALRVAAAIVAILAAVARAAAAQAPSHRAPAAAGAPDPTTDIFDVWRAFRHKDRSGRGTGLGLSQGDEGVRAGHRRQAVERRAVRRGRQHRVLSRRSGDDAHFLGGREPDVLDEGPDRDDRSLHDVRATAIAGGWKPIIAFSGPRSRRRRSARAPTRATACSPTSISSGCITPRTTSCGPVFMPAPACTTTTTSTSGRAKTMTTARRRPSGRHRRS